MFKRKITKAEFDAFTGDKEWMKQLYVADGDGYKINAENDDSAAVAEKARADEAERKLTELQSTVSGLTTQVATLTEEQNNKKNEKNKKDGKFDEIEADLKNQITAAKNETAQVKTDLENRLKDAIKARHAEAIASSFTVPDLVLPVIMSLLDVDITDGKNKVTVMKDGKATAQTLEDFKKELLAKPEYKSIVKASEASGGSAGLNGLPSDGKGGVKAFKDMTEQERVALHKSDPATFSRLSEEHRQQASLQAA